MKKNKGYYERFKDDQKKKQKEEKIRKKFNIGEDKKIIIEEKSKIEKVFSYLGNILSVIIKTILYLAIFGLSSIGATVLMNEPLRETFLELLQIAF